MHSSGNDLDKNTSLDTAYALCEKLAKTRYENFTIASRFLPKSKRKYLYALYAFCRYVDDLGDELLGDRLAALDNFEQEIHRCYKETPEHPYMIALQDTIRVFDIPKEPFLRLIQANRMDQSIMRYTSFADLESYCQNSANPVGHLVLYIFEYRDSERQYLSDFTCTALQLTNFWQDIVRDLSKGRIYIPQEDLKCFGYSEEDLMAKIFNKPFRNLIEFQVERTRALFKEGAKLRCSLSGSLKFQSTLYTLGGMEVLNRIQKQKYDVLYKRPEVSKVTKTRLTLQTLLKIGLT